MVELSDLVLRLYEDIPARDGIPSAAQYERCVKDAVADYSRRNPMERVTTLEIVSGTATYNLPADFLRLIRLEGAGGQDGVLITDAGLVPTVGVQGSALSERYTIAGGAITFSPTPTYTLARDLWYAAGHVPDEDGSYPDLTDEDVGVLMLLAQAKALMLQANAAAQQAWQYGIGDERVSKERLADSLRAQAERLEEQYLAEIKKLGERPWGTRADY